MSSSARALDPSQWFLPIVEVVTTAHALAVVGVLVAAWLFDARTTMRTWGRRRRQLRHEAACRVRTPVVPLAGSRSVARLRASRAATRDHR